MSVDPCVAPLSVACPCWRLPRRRPSPPLTTAPGATGLVRCVTGCAMLQRGRDPSRCPRRRRRLLSLRHRLDAPVLVHAARPADPVPTAGETSACSTSISRTSDRHAIESQSVPLSASFTRPERRSDDGQTILKVFRADQKPGPDLLLCGAPLRNRTVDLLLTMEIWRLH
jgi:hypothetical protein